MSFYSLGFTDPTIVSDDWGGVRQLANHYVQLISKVQRHGPYFLGGYSYGGLLAYEMASILTERNQRVEFVAMIDTFPWSPHSAREGKTSLTEDNILQQQNVEVCRRITLKHKLIIVFLHKSWLTLSDRLTSLLN